jgi:hypothetical protein
LTAADLHDVETAMDTLKIPGKSADITADVVAVEVWMASQQLDGSVIGWSNAFMAARRSTVTDRVNAEANVATLDSAMAAAKIKAGGVLADDRQAAVNWIKSADIASLDAFAAAGP